MFHIFLVSQKLSVPFAKFGHLGDGNIHTYILQRDMEDSLWEEVKWKGVEELFRLAVLLGGKISGEHGVGLAKKRYLPLAMSQAQINLLGKIKKAFDTHVILNPGKMALEV